MPSESATAYLARKHRGLLVARRIIRNNTRGTELPDDQNSSQPAAVALAGALPLVATEPRANARARPLLLLWGAVMLLPDDIQGWVIDMVASGLTIVIFLVVQASSSVVLLAFHTHARCCAIAAVSGLTNMRDLCPVVM